MAIQLSCYSIKKTLSQQLLQREVTIIAIKLTNINYNHSK